MSVNRYECGLTNAPTEYQSPTMYQDENGGYVFYEDYANLEGKCAALAAEKEKFAVECAATKIAIAYLKSGRHDFTLNTPATDALLAEVRAQGVEMLHAVFNQAGCVGSPALHSAMNTFMLNIASKIRNGEFAVERKGAAQ